MTQTYSISELSKEFGVTPRTIRHYEDEGLLAPERRGQTRVYNRRDRARLQLILRGKRVGSTLAEIKDWLDLYDLGDGQVEQMRYAYNKYLARIAQLEQQKADIEELLEELYSDCAKIEARFGFKQPCPDFEVASADDLGALHTPKESATETDKSKQA